MTEISQLVINNPRVVITFGAPHWCVPCQQFEPHFNAVSDRLEDWLFVHVDVDEADPIVTKLFGIQSVPRVLLFNKGSIGQRKDVEARTGPALIRELILTDAL